MTGACIRTGGRVPCRALTLLEVLVVVAIVALLAGLLLPSLSQARSRSRRLACASGLRQIAAAWHQYLDAHDGRFLRGLWDANLNYGGRQGAGGPIFQGPKPLNRYAGLPPVAWTGAELFACPCDTGADEIRPTFFEFVGTSYDTNPFLIGQDDFHVYSDDPCREVLDQLRKRLPRLRRSAINNEPLVLLMGDAGWVEAAHFRSERSLAWHGRRMWYNLAFMDGHAEFLRIRKGMHVTGRYTLLPFRDLQMRAAGVQKEVATPLP